MKRRERDSGSILVITLVFVVMFLVIFIGLSGLTSRQYREGVLQSHDERAFQVAEAGLNFARWRLSHNNEDLSQANGDVTDQFAGVIGSYEVTFEAPQAGSTIIGISSTGVTASQPQRDVTLNARYGIPSLARYAFVTNSDVWYGGNIKGYVHANGGIRMDGISDSVVSSAQETYTCQPTHGCNNVTKPGVWGDGEKAELWEFPVLSVDYTSISTDLLDIKDIAVSNGTYYPASGVFGYHVVFNSNNTYSIYKVTKKKGNVRSYDVDTGWQNMSHDINQETFLETRNVPSGGVIFVEDHLWVEGAIRDRVTIAAGKFPDTPSTNVDVILNDSLTYGGVKDGSRSLAVIAQRHVLIPFFAAPDVLTLDGAYIAQKGKFGRRHYNSGQGALKDELNRYGMIASNQVPVTAWVGGGGDVISGYREGEASYDPNMLYAPPPYFPTSGQYEFLSWEQAD